MTALAVRPERAGDEATIHALTKAAFRDHPHSDGSEPHLVDRLRRDGDLLLSLVAMNGERIVGHVAFSPVTVADGSQGWFGLGPLSVWPAEQGNGIGSALIHRGIGEMRKLGANGIVLLGTPAYYRRFGFVHDPELAYPGPQAEYFQRLVLSGPPPRGIVTYAPAFG